MIELVDNADRLKALTDFEHSICIEAGAGTGKTTVLVGRLVNYIKSGLGTIDELVAITFTEKAAGELKQRFKTELENAMNEALANGDLPVFRRLSSARKGLDNARISTIHSFAGSLLREYPVEAGIDPNYQQLDDISANELFDELWDAWLDDHLSQTCIDLRTYLELGGNLEQVRKLAYFIITEDDCDLDVLSPSGSFDSLWAEFRDAIYTLKANAEACIVPSDPGFCQISRLSRYYDMLSAADLPARKRLITSRPVKISRSAGVQSNWKPKETLKECKLLFASISDCLSELAQSVKGAALSGLYNLLKEFKDYYESKKAARGVIDFNDLLRLARNLIRSNLTVRGELQKRFKHVLIDEFQDTDPLQAEIAFFICEETPSATDWRNVILKPGKLFIVGDPKQSIYRFRNADIEIYEMAKVKIEEDGLALKIVQNFRTVKPIIDWVNNVFSRVMYEPEDGRYQPRYVALEGIRERSEPGLWVIGEPSPAVSDGAETHTIDDIRRLEARYIASTISDLVENELISVELKGTGHTRPVRYGDIAMLFPTRSEIDIYEEALRDFGIPYSMDGGKRYYARQEINSLISGLRAIYNPYDDVHIVAVLRSAFFGIPDDILFNHRVRGGQFNYLKPWVESEGALPVELSDAFETLKNLHELRNSTSISNLIRTFLERTRALEVQLIRPGGRQAAGNLTKVVDLARTYSSSVKGTLASFIDWLSDRRDKEIAEAESPTFEASDNVVQLMTIHKSKGLEFPVVFLVNLATVPDESTPFIRMKAEHRLEIKLGSKKDGFMTPYYTIGESWEAKRSKAEDIRLLYVAATRARDLLIISNFVERKDSYLSILQPSLESAYRYQPTFQLHHKGKNPEDPVVLPELLSARSHWIKAREAAKLRASQPLPIIRPSDHDSNNSSVELQKAPKIPVPEIPVLESTAGGAALGSLFHNTMELIDFERLGIITEREIEELVTRLAKNQGVEELIDRTVYLVSKCLAMPIMDNVRRAGSVYKEVPFGISFPDGRICEGKVDLIYRDTDGTYVLIDYKTDNIDTDHVDSRFDLYKEQGRIYLKALSQVLPETIKRIDFVFISPGDVRSISR